MTTTFTIAFSSHRSETLPLAEALMAAHEAVVIEEPPGVGFERMLRGELAVDDFLLGADYEYPVFAAASCRMLRRLHRRGRAIVPCEPFMDRLVRIHERLTDGERPGDFAGDRELWPVYQAEKEATGRLLTFYRASAARDFDAMAATAAAFAAADAARFVLRDRLRAAAIAGLAPSLGDRVYIEAGYMHLRLLRELRRRVPPASVLKPVYLLRSVYRESGRHCHSYGPGDRLTLAWIFDRPPSHARQILLAARSLVYNQLIIKEERTAADDFFPDARDDLAVIGFVDQLGIGDCRRLFPRIAGKDPAAARAEVGLPRPGFDA